MCFFHLIYYLPAAAILANVPFLSLIRMQDIWSPGIFAKSSRVLSQSSTPLSLSAWLNFVLNTIFPVVFLLNKIHPFLFVVALSLLHALSELLKVVFLERAIHLPLQPHVPFTTLGDALLQGLTANPEQCQGLPQPLITTQYSCVAPHQSQTRPIRSHPWQQEKNEDTTVNFHKITLISMETCSLYSEITCLFYFFLLLEQSNNNASVFF